MSRAAPEEIDFLGLEKGGASARATSVRGIQKAMSRLDPRLLRTVLTSGGAAAMDEASCQWPPSPMPVMGPAPLNPAVGSRPGGAIPMTIFYNGTVTVFDLPRQKAEAIIKWVEASNAGVRGIENAAEAFVDGGSQQQQQRPGLLLDKLGGDIPLARRKSLQRFLEKRKESRLTAVLPCPGRTSSSSCDWACDHSGEYEKGKRQKRQKSME